MADFLTPKERSDLMSKIRSKDTTPEIFIRKLLFKKGYRYRVHYSKLPGNPDLAFPKYHAVIFVHGCFWHGHNCHIFSLPKSKFKFWKEKITKNQKRDAQAYEKLSGLGWRICTIWECAITGKSKLSSKEIEKKAVEFLGNSNITFLEIKGR